MVKLRKTSERSPTSMIIEPPLTLNRSSTFTKDRRWRHMQYVLLPCIDHLSVNSICMEGTLVVRI